MRVIVFFCVLALLNGCGGGTAEAPGTFDVVSFNVIDTIPITAAVPRGVSRLALSSDGEHVYVISGGCCDNRQRRFYIIDTETKQLTSSILIPYDVGNINNVSVTPDGTRAYVAVGGIGSGNCCFPQQVESFDTADANNIMHLPRIFAPGSVFGPTVTATTPDNTRVYVTHHGSSVIHVIDTASNTIVDTVSVPEEIVGIAITPDGKRGYSVSRAFNTVTVVDTDPTSLSYNTQIDAITTSNGASLSEAAIAISPDGKHAYTVQNNSSVVSVIDIEPSSATFHQEVATISTTGQNLTKLTTTADGRAVMVVGSSVSEVIVLDVDPISPTFRTQIDAIEIVIGGPGDIAFEKNGTKAYVAANSAIVVLSQSPSDI